MRPIDSLQSPHASALVRMLEHDRPLNFRRFAIATQVSPRSAMRIRDDLAHLGLIEVSVLRQQGTTEILSIRLTPHGRDVAALLAEADLAMQRARARPTLASPSA